MKFKKGIFSVLFSVFFILAFCFNANAVSFNGVETGMSFNEVKNKIHISYHATDKGIILQKLNEKHTYLAFDKKNNVLMYRIIFQNSLNWDKLMNLFTEKFGHPEKRRNDNGIMTYFFTKGDIGFKMTESNEGFFQVWHGSVSLWNNFADRNRNLNKFPQ